MLQALPEDLSSDPARQIYAEEEREKCTDCRGEREREGGKWGRQSQVLISPFLSTSVPVSLIHKGYDGWPGQGPGMAFWQEEEKREG